MANQEQQPAKGKYYEKSLQAKEVLSLCKGGERNFQGAILRGQSFTGQDFLGADFSEADIRTTKFSETKLIKSKFSKTKCGSSVFGFLANIMNLFIIITVSTVFIAIGIKAFNIILILIFLEAPLLKTKAIVELTKNVVSLEIIVAILIIIYDNIYVKIEYFKEAILQEKNLGIILLFFSVAKYYSNETFFEKLNSPLIKLQTFAETISTKYFLPIELVAVGYFLCTNCGRYTNVQIFLQNCSVIISNNNRFTERILSCCFY